MNGYWQFFGPDGQLLIDSGVTGVVVDHDDLSNVTSDQHHAKIHDHSSNPEGGLIVLETLQDVSTPSPSDGDYLRFSSGLGGFWYNDLVYHDALSNVNPDDHHNQAHSISGTDHTGSLPHSSLSSVSADQHHNQAHDAGDHTNRTRYIWLGAGSDIIPDTATLTHLGSGATTGIMALVFSDAAQEYATATFIVPADWASGAITAVIYWSPSGTNTGDCRLLIETTELVNGDGNQDAVDTSAFVLSAGNGTANKVTVTSSLTLLTPNAAGRLVRLVLWRNGTAGSDTFTQNARVLGILLSYTADS